MEHDEIYDDTWEARETNGSLMLKMMYYQLHSVMLDTRWVWKN